MRFEETNVVIGKRNDLNRGTAEIAKMLSEFVKSGIEVAEVKEWDATYKSVDSAFCQAKNVIDRMFKGEVRVAKQGGRLFITRLK